MVQCWNKTKNITIQNFNYIVRWLTREFFPSQVTSLRSKNTTRASLKYKQPNNSTLLYTTQVNSAFGTRWLASSEVISQVLFTSEHRAARETLKIDHFSVNCINNKMLEHDWLLAALFMAYLAVSGPNCPIWPARLQTFAIGQAKSDS